MSGVNLNEHLGTQLHLLPSWTFDFSDANGMSVCKSLCNDPGSRNINAG